MLEKIRKKIIAFVESDKDVPLLAGFSVGFYMILFYYSKNFALANSWQQFLFFIGYYIALPIITLFAGYKILTLLKLQAYRRNILFIGIICFFGFYYLQLNTIGISKKIAFAGLFFVSTLLSVWLKRYYKLLVLLLLFLMTFFNVKPLLSIGWKFVTASQEWKKQPDDIENVKFLKKPNIYYLQPDGYASFNNLKNNKYYNFDNSNYLAFLSKKGFSTYDDYRSNYPSTLLSNSATFSMKHHYVAKDVESYAARSIIVGDNAVLRILKKNGYKTNFITENPYLLINRPKLGYDYTNIKHNEIPYFKDGFGIQRDVTKCMKDLILKNKKNGNFYFVEKFSPGHIHVYKKGSLGKEEERKLYLKNLQESNLWLKDIVDFITTNDPSGIIIIGADHGGFTGFEYSLESYKKVTDKDLIKSIFGAQLSIKWNNPSFKEFDGELQTGINLFRTVFSFLAEDKKYLHHLQENGSYMTLTEPEGLYKYISNDGKIVFEKR